MGDIIFFPLSPWRFWRFVRVGTAFYNRCHAVAELVPNLVQTRSTSTILDHVMEQCSDRFHFVSSVFQRNRADSKNMRNVWNAGLLSRLFAMHSIGIAERVFEFLRQQHPTISTENRQK